MNAILTVPRFDGIPVNITSNALQNRAEIITLSSAVVKVENGQELQLSVNASKSLKEFVKECESFCETEKAPFYNTYKKILAMTEELILPAKNEIARLKRLNDGFATAEANRVAEKNRRIQEEQRKKEAEVAAALAEQERIANLKKPNVKKEVAGEEKVIQAQTQLQQAQTVAPATMTRAAGIRIRKVVKFEITDRKALYAARPEFFDLVEKKSVINASITKETVLPGLKVWESVET